MIGAAASFKDLSNRGFQHESLNCVVFSRSSRSGVAGFRARLVQRTFPTFCATFRSTRPLLMRSMCLVRQWLLVLADTDLDVGSQQVSCDTAASAGLRSSFSGNRADGRPSLCSSEYAGGSRVAGGAGALHEESVGGADVHDQARVGSLSRTRGGRPCVNARIQDGVFHYSSGVSSHACASYLDALLAAPARAPAASTAARRVAPSSAVVGLGMHDDGSPVHDAHNSWSDTVGFWVPRAHRGSKVGFRVRPKICVLSRRWRQG